MMETSPTLAASPPNGFSSQTEFFRHHIPSGTVVNGNGYSAKKFRTLQPNLMQVQYGTPYPYATTNGTSVTAPQTHSITSNGLDAPGNLTVDYMTYDLVTETNGNTPNDSTTSTSFPSASSRGKSTSPSTVVHLASPSLPLESRGAGESPDYSRYRPRSSIPARLPGPVYAQQCAAAAYASRLNPYALHQKEQEALQDYLCHLHVTVYLNIRNGILRLWTRNAMVSVTRDEALGCAKDYRWMNLASFAYDWLVRNGYINFGCVEIPMPILLPKKGRRKDGPVIVVIGAGMAGLGCARQLEGLFSHYRDNATSPRVVVLEGRRRIGGRIYSHPLRSIQSTTLPPGLVPKAEMGAQIIVGFEHGNPLDQIVRSQLALSYHLLRDLSTLYDIDGTPVDEVRDATAESLYNDVLDRSGAYRHKSVIVPTAEGDRGLMASNREISTSDGVTVRQYEEARAAGTIGLLLPAKRIRRGVGHKTADIKPTRVPIADVVQAEENPAPLTCQAMGWELNSGVSPNETINLDPIAKASKTQTLGNVMDEGVNQYQRILPLTPKDMRLLNWHFANLEYANATNIGKLSLSGWDQDMGNEFEGEHSQVIGGYQQVPYGLWSYPYKLNLQTNKIVTRITYDPDGSSNKKVVVHCEDGDSIVADKVVYTGSLGTLKNRNIQFSPPLPDWKQGAIDRLGFGVMNKVILVFEHPFWDAERDMFGLLRAPKNGASMIQEDYAANRGRFYLFWNCMKTTGLPVLIALMAGDAAHQAERTPDAEIITEVMSQLRNVFKHATVPDPLETIITRWASDKFTRGTYSYVAAEALPGDYDIMAKPVGNLHFAGEATCGTHPATVHGAYLSGLRAASEIINSIQGPIPVPHPLVPEKNKTAAPGISNGIPLGTATPEISSSHQATPQRQEQQRQQQQQQQQPATITATASTSTSEARASYDQAMRAAVYAETGPPLPRPARTGLNPFILYQKDTWPRARAQCDLAHQAQTNNPTAKAPRDAVRAALGLMWRQASEDEKRPYLEQAEVNRQTNSEIAAKWKADNAEWEKRSATVKKRWRAENPYQAWVEKECLGPPMKKVNMNPVAPSVWSEAGPGVVEPASVHTVGLNGTTTFPGTISSSQKLTHTHQDCTSHPLHSQPSFQLG
ncbi:flavin-containing amine oxidoreductase-domain containing protein [Aspergillus pseudoustus]|uniref:Flavin-containing amine oxidoreductase-domain containing protein n=1 Tax=Aspergillus pseudoustus TaxID=1810923 RepID=A0ABR4K8E9_9EURO